MDTVIGKLKLKWLFLAAFLGAMLAFLPEAYAAFLPLPDATTLDVPNPTGETAIEKAENLLGPLARAIRIIIGAIAVALIVVAGFTMVVAGDNEETVKTQRKGITYGVVGLLMISIAGPVAEVFDYRQGNILEDPDQFIQRAELFDDTTRIVITFVKYFLGSLAALMFMKSGAMMIAQGYSEETVSREKKNLALSAVGLLIVIVSDLIVRKLLYDAEYNDAASETVIAINQNAIITQTVAVTNLIVTFVGPIMMLGIVAGGVLYIVAGGDEEKTGMAKKILLNSVIGVIIIYGAFALVSTVINGVF
jgi:hypothetical protein